MIKIKGEKIIKNINRPQKDLDDDTTNRTCIIKIAKHNALGNNNAKKSVDINIYGLKLFFKIQSMVVLISENAIVKWEGSKNGNTNFCEYIPTELGWKPNKPIKPTKIKII